jgi:hypothetical protein
MLFTLFLFPVVTFIRKNSNTVDGKRINQNANNKPDSLQARLTFFGGHFTQHELYIE